LTNERPLTDAEKALLPPPLAASVDLGRVRVVRRWHTPLAAALKVTIVRGARIFWANAPTETVTLLQRAHLAHELTHVWQYLALRRTGLELLSSRFYRYRLDPARVFLSYGYEQQAAIVEDYVRVSGGGAARWAVATTPPLAVYEMVIAKI
jgi:hypothetical protein